MRARQVVVQGQRGIQCFLGNLERTPMLAHHPSGQRKMISEIDEPVDLEPRGLTTIAESRVLARQTLKSRVP
ncbi:hypothetical protein GCM10010520_63630 [Rhizobium viscosum]